MVKPFEHTVAFHIETSYMIFQGKSSDWFLYEMQLWAEMGLK